jgi:hypothetical protein
MCADPHHEYLLAKTWAESKERQDVEELANVNSDEPEGSNVAQHDETSSIMS